MGRPKAARDLKSRGVSRAECGLIGKLPLATERNKYSEAAQALREGRVVDDTKYQYKLRIEAMKRWYHAEYKDEEVNIFAENGEFFIPLESEKVLDFLVISPRNSKTWH